MKFKSRKDILFSIFTLITVLILAGTSYFGFISSTPNFLWIHLLDLLGIVFFVWLFYDTQYELSGGFLIYKSGPFRGSIEINTIKEIVKNKTSWVELKPATATKGFIIKFGKFYDEIYISPNSNEVFIKEILKLNSEIKIAQ